MSFPAAYQWLDSVFWMRPCDGQQFIKATSLDHNTPAVPLSRRNYFQAVKSQRLWELPGEDEPLPIHLFAETSASVTTGEFFAAVSAESRLSDRGAPLFAPDAEPQLWRDCTEQQRQRFAVAITGRLESLRNPVLAPGAGFVIVDKEGKVWFTRTGAGQFTRTCSTMPVSPPACAQSWWQTPAPESTPSTRHDPTNCMSAR